MNNFYKDIKEFNIWNRSLKDRLIEFVSLMKHPKGSGGYYYSPNGDRFSFPLLCSTVFATKILYMLKNDIANKENMSIFMLQFLNADGSLYDKNILSRSLFYRIYRCIRENTFNHLFGLDLIRGETRQSYAALLTMNSLPKITYNEFDIEPEKINKYILDLEWRNPWTAGSNFGHLIFFLKINSIINNSNQKQIINDCFKFVNDNYKQIDGTWSSTTDIPIHLKINGAMKMLVAMSTAGIEEFDDSKKIIDLCLKSLNYGNACNHFNIIYILCRSTLINPNYRCDEIVKYLITRIKIYKTFWQEKYGGFSFYENSSNQNYLGCKITKGLNEPDIHASHLFLWGLILIDKILNSKSLYRLPIT